MPKSTKNLTWVKACLTGRYAYDKRERYKVSAGKTNGNNVLNYDREYKQGYRKLVDMFTSDMAEKVTSYCSAVANYVELTEEEVRDVLHKETAKMSTKCSLKKYLKNVPLCGIDWRTLCTQEYSAPIEPPLITPERFNYIKQQMMHALPNLFRWVNERIINSKYSQEAIEDNIFLLNFNLLLDIHIEDDMQQLDPESESNEDFLDRLMEMELGNDKDLVEEQVIEGLVDEVEVIEEQIDEEPRSSEQTESPQECLWAFKQFEELKDKWWCPEHEATVMFLVAVSLLNVSHNIINGLLKYLRTSKNDRRRLKYQFHKLLKGIEEREKVIPEGESQEERLKREEWNSRIQKIYFCKKGCQAIYQEDCQTCDYCKLDIATTGDYFRYFSPVEHIRMLYSDPDMANQLRSYSTRVQREGVYGDVWDGSLYAELREKEISSVTVNNRKASANGAHYFETPDEIMMELFTDGINPWSSKHEEYTVFVLVIHNLPQEKRFKNHQVIIPMVIPNRCGKDNGDFYSFLKPLIDDCAFMSSGFRVFDASRNETILVKAHLTFVGGDMPAVAKIMGFKGVQGDYPCRACEVMKNSRGSHNKGLSMLRPDEGAKYLRNQKRCDKLYDDYEKQKAANPRKRHNSGDMLKGLSDLRSPIFRLGSLDLPWSFPPDCMHLFFENIMHTVLKVVCGDCYLSLSAEHRDALNDMVRNFNNDAKKVIEGFPENLFIHMGGNSAGKSLPYMKAIEWKEFTEAFPFFHRGLNDAAKGGMYNVLLELTLIMRILCQQEITEKVLCVLEKAIPRCLQQFERNLNGTSAQNIRKMTVPLHTLLHMPDYVRRTGPPRRHWAFTMERMCRDVKMISKACREPSVAISNKVGLRFLAHRLGVVGDDEDEEIDESVNLNHLKSFHAVKAITGYVKLQYGGSEYKYEETNTTFLKRIRRSNTTYFPDSQSLNRSRVAFKYAGRMKYGEISSLVKIDLPRYKNILAVVESYKEDRLIRQTIESTCLLPDKTINCAVYYKNVLPEQRNTIVIPFDEIIGPIALAMDVGYPRNRAEPIEAIYYIHTPDGFANDFLAQLESSETS
jgi:hypothetical protein